MRRFWMGLSVIAAVSTVVALVWLYRANPTGQATGSAVHPKANSAEAVLWQTLAPYQDQYLEPYAEYLDGSVSDPMELVAAMNELAYNITGPGGLWRKTVPNKYFGCQFNDHHEICQRLKKADEDFARWDKLQGQMSEVGSRSEAQRFLKSHQAEIESYIRTYVPSDESFSQIQKTPFFQENLASALEVAY